MGQGRVSTLPFFPGLSLAFPHDLWREGERGTEWTRLDLRTLLAKPQAIAERVMDLHL
jgi:hypothetical protein